MLKGTVISLGTGNIVNVRLDGDTGTTPCHNYAAAWVGARVEVEFVNRSPEIVGVLGGAYTSGTSGIWTWKKYGDGTCHLTGTYSGTTVASTPSESTGYNLNSVSALEFPFDFINNTWDGVVTYYGTGLMTASIFAKYAGGISFYIAQPAAFGAGAAFAIGISIVGRWK